MANSLERGKTSNLWATVLSSTPDHLFSIIDMTEYMQDYGVDADTTDIAFHEHEQVAMHGIDLNVDASELQQPNEGNVFS